MPLSMWLWTYGHNILTHHITTLIYTVTTPRATSSPQFITHLLTTQHLNTVTSAALNHTRLPSLCLSFLRISFSHSALLPPFPIFTHHILVPPARLSFSSLALSFTHGLRCFSSSILLLQLLLHLHTVFVRSPRFSFLLHLLLLIPKPRQPMMGRSVPLTAALQEGQRSRGLAQSAHRWR